MGVATDELREWIESLYIPNSATIKDEGERIADRIDATYERVKAESIIDMTDEGMAEHGWIRLPVDADGVPIRVGDLIKLPNGKITAVRFITFNDAGWLINESGRLPERVTHYQPDTWERIIEDANACYDDGPLWDEARDALVARCRALAGEVDE